MRSAIDYLTAEEIRALRRAAASLARDAKSARNKKNAGKRGAAFPRITKATGDTNGTIPAFSVAMPSRSV
jgi:hypothetical protein